MSEQATQEVGSKRKKGSFVSSVWITVEYLSSKLWDALVADARVVGEEANLFLGSLLFIVGLFNWSVGKYCDGNSSDYLSCTRPTVYYYYSAFEVVLMVVGASLVLVWLIERKRGK
jgi:hypothetical protein